MQVDGAVQQHSRNKHRGLSPPTNLYIQVCLRMGYLQLRRVIKILPIFHYKNLGMYLSRHTHSITGHSFGFGQISGYTEIMARSRKTPKLGRFYHTKPQQIYDDHDGPWSKSCQTIRKQ